MAIKYRGEPWLLGHKPQWVFTREQRVGLLSFSWEQKPGRKPSLPTLECCPPLEFYNIHQMYQKPRPERNADVTWDGYQSVLACKNISLLLKICFQTAANLFRDAMIINHPAKTLSKVITKILEQVSVQNQEVTIGWKYAAIMNKSQKQAAQTPILNISSTVVASG